MMKAEVVNAAMRVAIATAALLLVPLFAMQLTTEVTWGPGDFLAAALLLFVSGMTCSLLARRASTPVRRAAMGLAVFLALAAVWAELAVGLFT